MINVIACSFAEAEGSTVIAGKEWRWEFHHYLGPTFLRKDGEPLKNQPGERHPVWDRFHDWYEKEYGPLPWREAEREEARAKASGLIRRRYDER